MAALPKSIGSRLLSTVVRPAVGRVNALKFRPYASSAGTTSSTSTEENPRTSPADSPKERVGVSLQEREQDPAEGSVRHNPDYNVAVDYRTSNFSPIPKRVMDGSEPGESVAAAVLSGAPVDLQARTVRIYRPTKTATQSGDWHSHHWLMDWDPLPKGWRWENPLMGWQSSADFMNGHRIQFKTKEDAINFANKQGYEYFVQEPNERKFVPKAYANNFTHSPGKLKIVRTK